MMGVNWLEIRGVLHVRTMRFTAEHCVWEEEGTYFCPCLAMIQQNII